MSAPNQVPGLSTLADTEMACCRSVAVRLLPTNTLYNPSNALRIPSLWAAFCWCCIHTLAVIPFHFSQSSISFNMGAHRVQVAHGDLWSPSPPRVPPIATTATASSATTTATAATWHTTQATQPMTKSLGGFQAGLVATYTLPRQMPPHSALTASRHILAAQARRQQLSKHFTSPSGMR